MRHTSKCVQNAETAATDNGATAAAGRRWLREGDIDCECEDNGKHTRACVEYAVIQACENEATWGTPQWTPKLEAQCEANGRRWLHEGDVECTCGANDKPAHDDQADATPGDVATTLDMSGIADLRGTDTAAIRRFRNRYPAGSPNAFPAPDDVAGISPWWYATRADELKAWKPIGRGKGGGRPGKTPAPAPAPAAQTETAPARPLNPMHRQVLERLVAVNESGPGWGNWVVGGHLDPAVDKYPYPTLKAMARNGHVELDTARQDALWTTSKPFSVAKLTTNGAVALAADTTTPTVHVADLNADQREALRTVHAARFTRTWHARRRTWELQLDGEAAPPHTASTVTELVHMGAVLLAADGVHITGAGHAALNAAPAQPDHADVNVKPVVHVTYPVFAWIEETARARQWQGNEGVIDGSAQDTAALTFLLGQISGKNGKGTRTSYGWTYGTLTALRRMVAHMVDTIDPARTHAAAEQHAAAVDNLDHLDKVISKTERQINRAKPAAPAPLKFKRSKESGAHLADDGTWKYTVFSEGVTDAFGRRRRYWRLTAVRPDDKTSLEESTHDTKAMCLAVAQEFSKLGLAYRPVENQWRSRMTEATARAYAWGTK